MDFENILADINNGLTSLNANTLAQVNSMNVELHNADGSLAGKYSLSNFLENVIYQFLATTKASALASVLGGKCPTVLSGDFDDYNVGTATPVFCYSLSSWSNAPSTNAGILFVFSEEITQNKKVVQIYLETGNSGSKLYKRNRVSTSGTPTWSGWFSVTFS